MVSLSAMMPHSRLYFYTNEELAFAHGYPMTDTALPKYRDCMKTDFAGMSATSVRSALGNGMHLPIQIAWFAFVVSNCVRKEDLNSLIVHKKNPFVNTFAEDEDSDDAISGSEDPSSTDNDDDDFEYDQEEADTTQPNTQGTDVAESE